MAPSFQPHLPTMVVPLIGALTFIMPILALKHQYHRYFGYPLDIIYYSALNILTCAIYHLDCDRARYEKWLVSEWLLHILSIMGGWGGALVGQYFLQHKPKKLSFQITFWIIVFLWQVFCWAYYFEDAAPLGPPYETRGLSYRAYRGY
ncbi:hypothetical protein P154DRAFT_276257 [Amniculicola lignicola CBS 123094]|uniref:DUF1294-domain-containing protein n=1 Tax=Amniculicola lignicola CBS 123094 TaxID=1392246 RepID=A0A6A5W8D2_9PLEO|nr:hypothetical protein P154DRAFT_276257 [Amniculicola lignicola CBS 123094]